MAGENPTPEMIAWLNRVAGRGTAAPQALPGVNPATAPAQMPGAGIAPATAPTPLVAAATPVRRRTMGEATGLPGLENIYEDGEAISDPAADRRNERDGQIIRGLARGAYHGTKSLVEGLAGLGNLVAPFTMAGQLRQLVDPQAPTARQSAGQLAGAASTAYTVVRHPIQTFEAARTAVQEFRRQFEAEQAEAERNGTTAEFYSQFVGRAGFEIIAAFVPASKLGEAVGLAGRGVRAGAALDGARAAGAGRTMTTAGVAEQAAERTRPIAVRGIEEEAAPAVRNAAERAAPAEAAAGSVDHVNPTGNRLNCTDCARSVDLQLRTGARTVAQPRSAARAFSELNSYYGTTFSGWVSRAEIERALLDQGENTRAIIYGMTNDGRQGHVWNAVVQRGRINYVDGQTGSGGARNFQYFLRLRFGITGGS